MRNVKNKNYFLFPIFDFWNFQFVGAISLLPQGYIGVALEALQPANPAK